MNASPVTGDRFVGLVHGYGRMSGGISDGNPLEKILGSYIGIHPEKQPPGSTASAAGYGSRGSWRPYSADSIPVKSDGGQTNYLDEIIGRLKSGHSYAVRDKDNGYTVAVRKEGNDVYISVRRHESIDDKVRGNKGIKSDAKREHGISTKDGRTAGEPKVMPSLSIFGFTSS